MEHSTLDYPELLSSQLDRVYKLTRSLVRQGKITQVEADEQAPLLREINRRLIEAHPFSAITSPGREDAERELEIVFPEHLKEQQRLLFAGTPYQTAEERNTTALIAVARQKGLI